MWIATLNIGLKRLLFFQLIWGGIIFCSSRVANPLSLFLAGADVGCAIIIIYLTFEYGLYIRKTTFRINGLLYEVRDFIQPSHPLNNNRGLYPADSTSTSVASQVFLTPTRRWAYFDSIRLFLSKQKNQIFHSALVLGGGGCAVPIGLLQEFPNLTIDIVEHSQIMIRIAKEYFISKKICHQLHFTEQTPINLSKPTITMILCLSTCSRGTVRPENLHQNDLLQISVISHMYVVQSSLILGIYPNQI